jgi:hypothetical protein
MQRPHRPEVHVRRARHVNAVLPGHADALRRFYPWIAFIGGITITPIATIMAAACGGAGHGTYLPAKVLFPYTMLFAYPSEMITGPLMALGLLQFPLYGVVVAAAACKNRYVLPAVALALLHGLAAALCLAICGFS